MDRGLAKDEGGNTGPNSPRAQSRPRCFDVPLNRLKFGIFSTRKLDVGNIAKLAARIHSRGRRGKLVVKEVGDAMFVVVAGADRLAALRMIYGAASSEPISCTLRQVDDEPRRRKRDYLIGIRRRAALVLERGMDWADLPAELRTLRDFDEAGTGDGDG